MVTKDNSYTLPWGNKNLQTATKDKTKWDIEKEVMKGTFEKEKKWKISLRVCTLDFDYFRS